MPNLVFYHPPGTNLATEFQELVYMNIQILGLKRIFNYLENIRLLEYSITILDI